MCLVQGSELFCFMSDTTFIVADICIHMVTPIWNLMSEGQFKCR